MRKLCALVATVSLTAVLTGGVVSPAAAQEADCTRYFNDFIEAVIQTPTPNGTPTLVELEDGSVVIRGDNVLAIVDAIVDHWTGAVDSFYTCFYQQEGACLVGIVGGLPSTDPATYVEIGLDGRIEVHFDALISDAFAPVRCFTT